MLDILLRPVRCIRARREGVETRYIVRTLVQNLRVNANWRSIIGPLARAVIMHEPGPAGAGAGGGRHRGDAPPLLPHSRRVSLLQRSTALRRS